MNPVIETRSLTKLYDTRAVVQDLDWTVAPGTACAFLGPNGSGKSTTLRMLMGFTQPSRGECRVLGEDPWNMTPETRARVGYVSEDPLLPPWMTVEGLVSFHRGLYPRWSGELERELLDLLEIRTRQRVAELSKGEHRRVMLLLALCQGGDLLLLDEPGSGLDVSARRQLLKLLSRFLAEEGRSLVFSTHIVTDVERIASHVAILRDGALVAQAGLDELHENVKSVRLSMGAYERTRDRWEATGVLAREAARDFVVLTVRRFATHGEFVLRDLSEGEVVVSQTAGQDVYMGADGEQAQVLHLPLEDIFLALTGARAEEEAA